MSEVEKEMAEAVLEAIDLRLKPVLGELKALNDRVEGVVGVFDNNFQKAHDDVERLVEYRKEFSEKFVVTARLIEAIIDAMEKTSRVRRSEDEVKGLKFLKGEPY